MWYGEGIWCGGEDVMVRRRRMVCEEVGEDSEAVTMIRKCIISWSLMQ